MQIETRTFLWLSHLQVSKPSCTRLWRSLPHFSHSLKIIYLNRILVKSKTSRNGNVKSESSREIRSTTVLSEFSTFLKIIKSKEQIFLQLILFTLFRLTVKIFQFLRLSTKFWAVLRLSVNPIETRLSCLNYDKVWTALVNGALICTFDIIGSLNARLFQIWSLVAGYGELCMCF